MTHVNGDLKSRKFVDAMITQNVTTRCQSLRYLTSISWQQVLKTSGRKVKSGTEIDHAYIIAV